MKELSIEQKAKAYDEAIKRLEDIKTGKCQKTFVFTESLFDYIFPELVESEDERIRKALISFLKSPFVNESITDEKVTPWIAWLEKQGEHAKFRDSIQVGDKVTRNEDGVLVNLSQLNRVAKKDEKQGEQKSNFKVGDIIKRPKSMVTYKVTNIDDYGFQLDGGHWFKLDRKSEFNLVEQKPWSEEDEREVDILKAYINSRDWSDSHIDRALGIVDELVKKLKSLRPQSTWKPSDEQIKSFEHFVRNICESGYASPYENNTKLLYSLLEDLKKLK